MAGKRRPSFVDGYVVQRLREHSWEESHSYSQPGSKVYGDGHSSRHEGLWAKSHDSVSPPSGLLLSPKSEVPTLHTLTTARKESGISTEPISLEKRYRYNASVHKAAIPTPDTSAPAGKKSASHLLFGSPSATRRGLKKIRRGYSTTKTPPTLLKGVSWGSGRSISGGVISRATPVGVATGSRPNHDISLPLVGQKSNSAEEKYYPGVKSQEQYHLKRSSHPLKRDGHSSRFGDARLPGGVKKSHSLGGGVGGASEWRCGGVRGWRSACEDSREEMMATLTEDTLSIEDATDESVAETEGEAGDRGAEWGEEGVGFSEDDLTDFEDATTTDTSSPRGGYLPHPDPMPGDPDTATYILLKKASQQLELLSIASDSEDSISSSRSRGSDDLPRLRKPRRTKRTTSRPNHTTTGQRVTTTDQTDLKQDHTPREKLSDPSTGKAETEAAALREERVPSLPSPPLTPSLFPHLAPTIHFPMPNEPYTPLPAELRSQLKWKMSTITPNIIKNCIARAGFTPCSKGRGWLGYWGKHMRSQAFRAIQSHQKVNHFPGSFEIGRKDRLWRNLSRLQIRVGRKNLDFVPLTFVLPQDLRLLKREWESRDSSRQKWILKPPAAARGIGVRVIHRWNQIPKRRPIIVQKYIADPLCIRGNKVDLRVYVYVSSYDPLLIYVFPDGLTRFATCKYSSSTRSLSNRFIHLTNYSVNKKNSQFSQNSDETVCQGHKWGLLALWRYMRSEMDIDTDDVWSSIVELVIKTIICSESHCSSLVKTFVQNSYSCHELFGFDIVLDQKLKPWLVEVNISPSLHSNSKLDINIKGQLVRDLLNIAGFKLPANQPATETQQYCGLTVEERQKHSHFLQRNLPEHERRKILGRLTPGDITVLVQAEDEFSRRGSFERVFPSHESSKYRKYFESEKYNNILLEQWLMKYQHIPDKGVQLLQKLSTPHV